MKTIHLTDDTHKKLKLMATELGATVSEFIQIKINESLQNSAAPTTVVVTTTPAIPGSGRAELEEWVQDCGHENYNGAPTDGRPWGEESGRNCGQRVIRGGSWGSRPVALRASYRFGGPADSRSYDFGVGFRLAQDLK